MKVARVVLVVALSAITLGACGASTHLTAPFVASTDCTLSVTNVDYAGCDLAHHDLVGLDVASDNFRRANLSYANLDGANMQGADLLGAKTIGVLTNNVTICVNAARGPCTESGLRGR
jgi:uncharacterized protein YjbI with pentapeptide repeats